MLRLVGAILVAGGATAVGLAAAGMLKTRVDVLSSLVLALDTIHTEITFRLTPLPELMRLLEKQTSPPANELFINCTKHMDELGQKTFSSIWITAVEESAALGLTRDEKQILEELGVFLGRYDAESQVKAIAYTRHRLQRVLDGALDDRQKQGKLYKMLGVITGAAVVIILI